MEWNENTIRTLREHIGESVAEFADRLGLARQTVYALERETSHPQHRAPSDTLRRLLDYIAEDAGFTAAKVRANSPRRP